MFHKRGESQGTIYHVRKNEVFDDGSPVLRQAAEATVTYGRSEIQHLSKSRAGAVAQVLDAYRNDTSNLPYETANGQNWTVGALSALEQGKLIPGGTSDYWDQNVGRASSQIGDRLRHDGKSRMPTSSGVSKSQGSAGATLGMEKPVTRLHNLDKLAGLGGSS